MDDRLKKLVDKSIDFYKSDWYEMLTSADIIVDEFLDEAYEISNSVSKQNILDAVRSSKKINDMIKIIIQDTADNIYKGIKYSKTKMKPILEEKQRNRALDSLKITLTSQQRKLFKKANIKI